MLLRNKRARILSARRRNAGASLGLLLRVQRTCDSASCGRAVQRLSSAVICSRNASSICHLLEVESEAGGSVCCVPTVSDEGPACQHFAEHELDHGQDDAHQAADDGHAEQEPVLGGEDTQKHSGRLCRGLTHLPRQLASLASLRARSSAPWDKSAGALLCGSE